MNYHLRPRSIIYVFITFVFLLWLDVLILRAADRYVVPPGTPGGTDTGAFTDWSIAATQIQWAVDAAAAGETVWVTNGTYNLTNRITISKAITNRSVNGPTATFINGNYPAYSIGCFTLQAKVYLAGFTITNGYATTNYGAGIEISGEGFVVSNCVIADNHCSYYDAAIEGCAGGISIKSGGIVANCIISNNYADSGGGIYMHNWNETLVGSVVIANKATNGVGGGINMNGGTVSNCIIQANTASNNSGGGIYHGASHAAAYIYNSTITQNRGCVPHLFARGGGMRIGLGLVKDCIISNNSVDYTGGGVELSGAVTLQNCIIISNHVSDGYGGGISIGSAAAVVQNCLVAKNVSSSRGGGIWYANIANAIVRDCTIVSNLSNSGGGIYNEYTPSTNLVENSIVYDNTASTSNNYWGVFIATNSCSYPLLDGTGNITDDPGFVNKDTGNWRLSANSPCVNRGTNQSWMTNSVDLDGKMRIRYDRVDMGAYERIFEGTIYIFH